MKWYRRDELKFEKVAPNRYVCGNFEIVNVNGYHFAFHKGYLLNRLVFSKEGAYRSCLDIAAPWR
jgi:hypothetical protein